MSDSLLRVPQGLRALYYLLPPVHRRLLASSTAYTQVAIIDEPGDDEVEDLCSIIDYNFIRCAAVGTDISHTTTSLTWVRVDCPNRGRCEICSSPNLPCLILADWSSNRRSEGTRKLIKRAEFMQAWLTENNGIGLDGDGPL